MRKAKRALLSLLVTTIISSIFMTTASAFDISAFFHHPHEYRGLITISATCQRKGFSFSICKTCLMPSFRIIGITDHNRIIETTEATCTEDGFESRQCSMCKETITEVIKATGHQYSEWIADGDNEKRICKKCGETQLRDSNSSITDVRGDIKNRKTITTGKADCSLKEIGDYVTPEMYGAYADGIHDDTLAIQSAVDSGKNVLFDNNKTYYIASEKYINIANKSNLIISGGKIHKAASDSNNNCFVITGCKECVFQDMYIYSEFTAKDFSVPKDHQRPTDYSSNVLAFSGWNNTNITFLNNSFDCVNSDYWFNANPGKGEWKNITVNGWKSTTSIMPLYCQYTDGLEIKNANLGMSTTHAGDGDHILYVCEMSRNVTIHDCYMTKNTSDNGCVLLTFHGGNQAYNTNPKNITLYNCTIDANREKAIYSGNGTGVTVKNCTFTSDVIGQNMYLVSGDRTNVFNFENCILETKGDNYCLGESKSISINNCVIRTDNAGVFAGPFMLTVSDTDIEITSGVLCFSLYSDGFDYAFENCNITKSTEATYLTSIRQSGGSLSFKGCNINCPNTRYFMYNSGVDMSAVSFENTAISCYALAKSDEAKGYKATNSTLNGAELK